jgi:hypothetical protein
MNYNKNNLNMLLMIDHAILLVALACLTPSQLNHKSYKCKLRNTGRLLRSSGTLLRVAGIDLWVAGTDLWITGTDLRVAGTDLWITGTDVRLAGTYPQSSQRTLNNK